MDKVLETFFDKFDGDVLFGIGRIIGDRFNPSQMSFHESRKEQSQLLRKGLRLNTKINYSNLAEIIELRETRTLLSDEFCSFLEQIDFDRDKIAKFENEVGIKTEQFLLNVFAFFF